jgi:hypothetical protein
VLVLLLGSEIALVKSISVSRSRLSAGGQQNATDALPEVGDARVAENGIFGVNIKDQNDFIRIKSTLYKSKYCSSVVFKGQKL